MNEETRIFLGILCLAVAIWFSILGGRRIWAYVIFEKHSKKTKKTGAILQDAAQKGNVRVGIRRPFFVKHMTKAVYAYKVEGKVYYIKATRYLKTKRQTPKFVPVVYITAHPKFAYIDEQETGSDTEYLMYGAIFVFWALLSVAIGLVFFGVAVP